MTTTTNGLLVQNFANIFLSGEYDQIVIEMTNKMEINQHINAVMETMKWPDDAFVPIANEENRKLMECLQDLMSEKYHRAEYYKRLSDRLFLLKDHHQNAQSDIVQNLVSILNTKLISNGIFEYFRKYFRIC